MQRAVLRQMRFVRAILLTLLVLCASLAPAHSAHAVGDDSVGQRLPVLRSRHYRIHSDLDNELLRDLARRMDAMFDEYAKRLAGFGIDNSAASSMEAYLFQHHEDYLQIVGPEVRNTWGVTMPGRNLLAAFLEGQGRDDLRKTLQHEAFHQFAAITISKTLPSWLNEGLAQVFQEGIWTGDSFLLGQVPPHRIRQLQFDIKNRKLLPFEQIMSMTHEKWNHALAGDSGAGATQYNEAWAMVHMLVHARDATGREPYRGRLIQMLELLHQGKDGREAFESSFSPNIKGFQDRFVEYARSLEPTPEAAMMERQDVLAHMLVFFREKGLRFNRIAEMRDAAVRGGYHFTAASSSGLKWTSDPDVKNYFSDPGGKLLGDSELYFTPRGGAPLPDIVCRATERVKFRTRFHRESGDKVAHEVLVEN
jgi:hypothetical protein